ncbi:MAG TPA: DinB family protein [Pyrinomonadaceae bacterium]
MIENYRRWFTYERHAHALVLDSLRQLNTSQQATPSFQKAVDLFAHIVAARRVWLFRFGFAADNAELFPQNVQLENVTGLLQQMEDSWGEYLDKLTDDELNRAFEYQSYEGQRFRNTIGDILTQLFGHSWYHRGQIAALVRSIGGEPAVTDFVYWTREAVD